LAIVNEVSFEMGWITMTNQAWSYACRAAFPISLGLVVPKGETERGQHAPMRISNDQQDRIGMEHCAYLAYEACPY